MKLIKKCRLCRAEGKKLFLKGERCDLPKCSFTRRSYGPGKKQKTIPRYSEYGKQLRAKQSAKRTYGLSERALKNYYKKASKTKAATGEQLLTFLETRLDNVVFRLGFAPSRNSARQLVSHGKILVNNKVVTIPSFAAKKADIVAPAKKIDEKNKSRKKSNDLPVWLKLDTQKNSGTVVKLPSREELSLDIDDQLIVEFYSR